MEPRNDRTWLLIGVGMGCLFVAMLVTCGATGVVFYLSRSADVAQTPSFPPPTIAPIDPPPLVPPTRTPPPTTTTDDGSTLAVHATIDAVTGTPGVTVGQTCEFNVERRDREGGDGFWCNAQIVCAGHLLYGGPTAGFFPCTLFYRPTRGVVGSDPNTTGQDGDAAMSIDTAQSHLEIWDDAQGPNGELRVTAHIDSLQ